MLNGGNDQDILIAGGVSVTEGFAAILSEWASERSYSQRSINIRKLSGESNAANAPYYLIGRGRAGQTVFDDDAANDKLTGGNGLDLFFTNAGFDILTDRETDEDRELL